MIGGAKKWCQLSKFFFGKKAPAPLVNSENARKPNEAVLAHISIKHKGRKEQTVIFAFSESGPFLHFDQLSLI